MRIGANYILLARLSLVSYRNVHFGMDCLDHVVTQTVIELFRTMVYIDRSLSALLGRSCAIQSEEYVTDLLISRLS